MPSILVLEQDPRSLERIHHTLGAAGWRIRSVHESGEAFQAAAAERPDLVIVGAGTPGADAVAGSFSRRSGGPGVLGLLPPGGIGADGLAADEVLAQPFSDQELLAAVQRAGTAPRPVAAAPRPPRLESKLTSQDIFGDVLAEIDEDEPDAAPAPAPAAAPPAPPAPAPPRPRPSVDDDDINRKLEKTLSGVFGSDAGRPRPAAAPPPPGPVPPPTAAPSAPQAAAPAPPRAAAPAQPQPRPAPSAPRKPDPAADDDIDAILSRTLGNLEIGPRPRPPVAPPAAPAPPPVSATAPPSEGTAVRRAPRMDAGLQLEELTRNLRNPTAPAAPQPPRPAAPPAAPAAPAAAAPAPAPSPSRPLGTAPPPLFAPAPVFERPAAPPRAPEPTLSAAPPPKPEPPSASLFEPDPFDLAALEIPPPVEPEPVAGPEPAVEPEPEAPFELVDLDFEPEPLPVSEPPAAEPPRPVLPELDLEPLPEPSGAGVLANAAAPGGSDFAATQRIPVVLDDSTLNIPGAERFGQYTLLEKIAAGGMAEVWKARMRGVEGFQKTVAIKKILPHMTDNSEFIGMFIDEAKLAAQLSHPNIVHIYDLGKIGRDYYIAMEYVEGKDLRSLLNASRRKGRPLPVGLSLLIASRLASALDYAHRKRDFEGKELGLVHRDVSPQNVLLTHEGDVKLCDFGIAKAVSKAGQTQMGSLKGKLQYMSPEQAWGRPVDARSDIFSLGAVLFEMLTGERLFSGDSEMSILEAVRQGRIRTPRDLAPVVPPEVDEIVARALAYDVRDRFQSAGEMMQRLDAALHSMVPSPGPGELSAFLERVFEPEPSSDVLFIPPPATPPAPAAPPPPATPPQQRLPEPEVPASLFMPEAFAVPSPPASASPEPSVPVEAVAPVGDVHVEETGGRKSRLFLVIAIVVLLVAAIATFLFLRGRRGDTPPPAAETSAPAAAPAAVQPPPPAPAPAIAPTAQSGPAAEQVDVQAILEEELARREKELRRKYEAEEKRLQRELDKAQRASQAQDGPPPETQEPPPPRRDRD